MIKEKVPDCRKSRTTLTQIETCPDCSGQLEETTICGLDPQDTIDIFVCSRCSWKERRFIDDMTPEEVLDRIDEIPFENSEIKEAA